MAINLGSGGLRQKRSSSEDIDPMATVANISDAMLVFACGLMVALISYWNIDVGPSTSATEVEVDESEEMVEVEDLDELSDELSAGSGYEELGTVYEDPTTGKMYMIVEDDGGEDSSDSSDSTDGSDDSDGGTSGSE